jgi:hypothetical protein
MRLLHHTREVAASVALEPVHPSADPCQQRTVVLRGTASLHRVVGAVEDLVHELEAEQEVERLLSSAENE